MEVQTAPAQNQDQKKHEKRRVYSSSKIRILVKKQLYGSEGMSIRENLEVYGKGI